MRSARSGAAALPPDRGPRRRSRSGLRVGRLHHRGRRQGLRAADRSDREGRTSRRQDQDRHRPASDEKRVERRATSSATASSCWSTSTPTTRSILAKASPHRAVQASAGWRSRWRRRISTATSCCSGRARSRSRPVKRSTPPSTSSGCWTGAASMWCSRTCRCAAASGRAGALPTSPSSSTCACRRMSGDRASVLRPAVHYVAALAAIRTPTTSRSPRWSSTMWARIRCAKSSCRPRSSPATA